MRMLATFDPTACCSTRADAAQHYVGHVKLDVDNKCLIASNGRVAVRIGVDVSSADVGGYIPAAAITHALHEAKNKEADFIVLDCALDDVHVKNGPHTIATFARPKPSVGEELHFRNALAAAKAGLGAALIDPRVAIDTRDLRRAAKALGTRTVTIELTASGQSLIVDDGDREAGVALVSRASLKEEKAYDPMDGDSDEGVLDSSLDEKGNVTSSVEMIQTGVREQARIRERDLAAKKDKQVKKAPIDNPGAKPARRSGKAKASSAAAEE